MNDNEICEKQKNLSLSELRKIFQKIDELTNEGNSERDTLQGVAYCYPDYDYRFLRWLVRHTIHPETDDDIMEDGIKNVTEQVAKEGSTLSVITFNRVPTTIKETYLVQFKHTFWHIIAFNSEKKVATLKLLSDYT